MGVSSSSPGTIDDYIAAFPADVRKILERIRTTIRRAAPQAVETMSYRIPTFKLHGNLISFAAYQKHIGLYPAPTGSKRFNERLSAYRAEKSTVRFPLDRPIPFTLITDIVKLRVKDNLSRAKAERKKKGKRSVRR